MLNLTPGLLVLAQLALGVLPDHELTPGAADPAVTQATIGQTICRSGYTAKVRNVPAREKREVLALYRAKHPDWPACLPGACEYDHLISLELGGSNEPENLWPEPYQPAETGARAKDQIENALHRRVCSGAITLEEAQRRISIDWTKALEAAP